MNYEEFLRSKITVSTASGFEIDPAELHPQNKPHQSDGITWALRMGRALLAWSFGLGKSRAQIEIAQAIHRRTGKPFLIVCPLGVRHQFTEEDGPALDTRWQYVRNDAEARAAGTPYLITNYERVRDGGITADFIKELAGVSLDEGSVLRSLSSETSDVFKRVFAETPYRFVCTATPAPNEYKELIYYAEFLGVMDHGQALTRFFKRDSEHAGHLTIMPSQDENFWMWVASWALFLTAPSDLGYDDTGYSLPELRVHWHRLGVDHTRAWEQQDDRGQRRLLLDATGGVSQASQEKKATLADRMIKLREILADNPDRHWLLWHTLERERDAIEREIPGAVTVYGSQDLDEREQHILDFTHGKIPILATKMEIAGSGCNFQRHCYSNIYLGVDYKFQDFIQSVHRTQRFLQDHPVDVHIIYAESEDGVIDVLKRKWQAHNELVKRMRGIIRSYGLSSSAIQNGLSRKMGVNKVEVKGTLYTAVNADCVEEVRRLPDNFAGLIHTSIPFGNHYEYSVQYEDFGHNPTDAQFWEQMDYLIPELLRVLKPGRVAAIHVKDRQLYGHQTKSGIMETAPFSDECVMAFRKHGFTYQGRRTIVTDVVRENSSTYRLAYTEMTRDASKMSSGLPEYLLLFRKPPSSTDNARADEPITKSKTDYSLGRWQIDAHAFWRSNGNRPLTPAELAQYIPEQVAQLYKQEQLSGPYDYKRHVEICEALEAKGHLPKFFMLLPPKVTRGPESMVWDDVVYMRTLNLSQYKRNQENHICPLPFDIVERAIELYSNPGDIIVDPFGGIGTVPYMAIKMGRRAWASELHGEYFTALTQYCHAAEQEVLSPTLFDFAELQVNSIPTAAAD